MAVLWVTGLDSSTVLFIQSLLCDYTKEGNVFVLVQAEEVKLEITWREMRSPFRGTVSE